MAGSEAAYAEAGEVKMSEVKVGMRLKSTIGGGPACSPITVTEITDRGFKYKLDGSVPFIPRWGTWFPAEGHEHFGINGESLYEPES